MKLAIAAGVAAFIAGEIVTSPLRGPATCRDGWHSSSIGRQGACSHHGGVVPHGSWTTLISLILGGAAGAGVHRLQQPRSPVLPMPSVLPTPPRPSRAPITLDDPGAADLMVTCLDCGAPMRAASVPHGKRLIRFWRCSRAPECKGIRHYV